MVTDVTIIGAPRGLASPVPSIVVIVPCPPEIHRLRKIGPGVPVVGLHPCARHRKGILIHLKERLHQVQITRCDHRMIGQPGVLKPVWGTPLAEIRIPLAPAIPIHGKNRTVEFDGRVSTSPGGIDEPLQQIATGNAVGVRRIGCLLNQHPVDIQALGRCFPIHSKGHVHPCSGSQIRAIF